jgi:hypothetical protein
VIFQPLRTYLVNKYQYPSLRRVTGPEGYRTYTDGKSAPVASVTTILDRTADKTHLDAWRQRVGHDEAQRQVSEAAGLGTLLHNQLEKYLLGETIQFGGNLGHQIVGRMAGQIISKGLCHVDEIWGCEVGVINPELYAGTTDAVGVYKGRESIIDFKNSKKIKRRDWIEDYFCQTALYGEAHNQMTGSDIRQAVILMADREGNFAEFIIADDEYAHYLNQAAKRLARYYGIAGF